MLKLNNLVILYIFSKVLLSVTALYKNSTSVTTLTNANFNVKIFTDKQILWVVEFHAKWCDHCKEFSSEYEKAAKALNGFAKFGAINGEKYWSVSDKYQVREYPTVLIFGFNKRMPTQFDNENRTAASLVDAVIEEIRRIVRLKLKSKLLESNILREVCDETFEEYVLDPNEGMFVYFYEEKNKDSIETAKMLQKVSKKLKGKIKFAVLNLSTNELFKDQGLHNQIVSYKYGKKTKEAYTIYTGELVEDAITEWALNMYEKHKQNVDVVQIVSDKILRSVCEHRILCIISFLPDLITCPEDCRTNYLNTIKELNLQFKRENWGWVWTEAKVQYELEASLDVNIFGYPSIIAVYSKKKIYFAPSEEAFTLEVLGKFFKGVVNGKADMRPIGTIKYPKIKKVNKWEPINKTDAKDEL